MNTAHERDKYPNVSENRLVSLVTSSEETYFLEFLRYACRSAIL